MNQYKRIFIIGHPGAGKGVLAKALAKELGWQFINADLGLEFRIGRTLPDIVGKQQGSRYLVIDFSHPWPKSTRQRAKCLPATVLRPARCPERASVCFPQ